MPAATALAEAGLEPLTPWSQGRAGTLERHPVLDRLRTGGPVRGRDPLSELPSSRELCRPRRPRARIRRSTPASTSSAVIVARSRRPKRYDGSWPDPQIRASHLTGDARVQDPYCLRCQPQVMGAVLDLLRQAAAYVADRVERRVRQPARLPRGRSRRSTRCSRAATSTPSRSPSPPT